MVMYFHASLTMEFFTHCDIEDSPQIQKRQQRAGVESLEVQIIPTEILGWAPLKICEGLTVHVDKKWDTVWKDNKKSS
jgi:hypothetical protein